METNKNKWVLSLVVFFMMFTIIAISFAYFTGTITINGTINSTKGSAEVNNADIDLINVSSNVSLTNSYPMTKSQADANVTPYSFKIKNNSQDHAANVQIILEIKDGNTLPDRLTDASISTVYGRLTDTTKFTTTTATLEGYVRGYILLNDTLAANERKSYDLRIWIDELGNNIANDENNVENKSWYGKIVVKAAAGNASTPVEDPEDSNGGSQHSG